MDVLSDRGLLGYPFLSASGQTIYTLSLAKVHFGPGPSRPSPTRSLRNASNGVFILDIH